LLEEYERKRNFSATAEPPPKKRRRRGKQLTFVVQKHAASRLHYDFRLEADGVLKSWAVPKGPALDPAVKRLAMMVEDHPIDYASFEGIIPKGQYGGGTVIVWDRGIYAPLDEDDHPILDRARAEQAVLEGLEKGKLVFAMEGAKLHGGFALIRARGQGAWMLIKMRDSYAAPDIDVTKLDRSAISNLNLEEMAARNESPPTRKHTAA